MSDLISRQAAIDAFMMATADGDKAEWCEYVIKQVPSAEPEIIRCKDCKHQEKFWHGDKRRKDGGYYIYGCELAEYSHVCLDDDYCSKAERRTDG